MSLLTEFRSYFSKRAMTRGQTYRDSGRVQLIKATGTEIEAVVRGDEQYDVFIEFDPADPDDWGCDCTCPYFEDHDEPCKHIWATLLEADRQGKLPAPTAGRPVNRRFSVQDEVDLLDEGEVDDPLARAGRSVIHDLLDSALSSVSNRQRASATPAWKSELERLEAVVQAAREGDPPPEWPADRRVVYIIDRHGTLTQNRGLILNVGYQNWLKSGRWSRAYDLKGDRNLIPSLPDPADRYILQMLVGSDRREDRYWYYETDHRKLATQFVVGEASYDLLLKEICKTGRCLLKPQNNNSADLVPLQWDDGPPWRFVLSVEKTRKTYRLRGLLQREDQEKPLDWPQLMLAGGKLIAGGRIASFDAGKAWGVAALMRDQKHAIEVPLEGKDPFGGSHRTPGAELVEAIYNVPKLPEIRLPEELQVQEERPAPVPLLTIQQPKSYDNQNLVATLKYLYGEYEVDPVQSSHALLKPERRTVMIRDADRERQLDQRLQQLGFRWSYTYSARGNAWRLPPSKLAKVVATLTAEGWQVQAEGKLYRQAGEIQLEVVSGIDWFDLNGHVEFGEQRVAFPKLLAALAKGDNTVTLDDGTIGVVPEQWLKQYGLLAGLGKAQGDSLRFGRHQVGLLDALLAAMPEARCDEVFDHARNALRQFDGLRPLDPPETFTGTLRPYQCEGLGWMQFLQRFGFVGCLADDMGLGKTVQVLALLDSRRKLRETGGDDAPDAPSLVVVPRSLIFNWQQEAVRFAPQLRVLDHTGPDRTRATDHFSDYDLILTTYGTLRRDAAFFKDAMFDYVILDEAQAIKNATTDSAKAVRLLRGRHRLALSGTPVENHLRELWSLFEFLNPGMLGTAAVFKRATTASANGNGNGDGHAGGHALLSRALRPFILRRTKGQVAADLPDRIEQTIYCELEPKQRKLYDELRDYYRQSLLGRIEEEGLASSKMHVLEALLRLRQAACHPALLDKTNADLPSAKLDVLLPQLAEVVEEGHKVLVFSQFTSLLAIVRQHFDRQKVVYEYLDGKTTDRQARVERFQSDPDCRLFLISLKAGGLGLNLTAAEYVYLLDPWWNPAVEAQAIDRAHRIGQTRQVVACRLIARDTVEEKVLSLQQTKRDLADAIITADNSLISRLSREDLELLLT